MRLPLPPEPTQAVPGSEEKILVLAWRVANRYNLWHPEDATFGTEERRLQAISETLFKVHRYPVSVLGSI